ncbi:MAG: UvrB/UvrC motif-containing protein, partial [Prevotella sp.]
SLVAILDADKEGFLRSHRSLTQTAGRAARNVNGKVIMYADTITESMRKTIDETLRRRTVQLKYNEEHNITPQQIEKSIKGGLASAAKPAQQKQSAPYSTTVYHGPDEGAFAADPIVRKMSAAELRKSIENTAALMKEAAKQLDFMQAAQYRDEMLRLQKLLDEKE